VINYQNIAEEYKSCLEYILDNLEGRSNPNLSCAKDEKLIKYIKYTLSDEGLNTGINITKTIEEYIKN